MNYTLSLWPLMLSSIHNFWLSNAPTETSLSAFFINNIINRVQIYKFREISLKLSKYIIGI
jgi:hypothetical protein